MDTTPGAAEVAALFDRIAEQYDNVGMPLFGPVAQRLVTALRPAAGEDAASRARRPG